MGVHGLWPILHPCARPTPLPTLNRKRLAVDASIWIYQFLKAVRDKEGNALRNSHVVGFFRRICKLLYFGIKPVFVFDGGAPVLKRQTITGRKQRREGRREDAVRTAGKLLAVQMKRKGEEEEEKRKRDRERAREGLSVRREEDDEDVITGEQDLVYVGEMGMSAQERQQTRKFYKKDAYHLPDLTNGIEGMGQPNDPRVMSVEELEEYARQFNSGEDINLYDFSKIDFNGDFFMSLPAGDRYNILNAARLRSRLRMGLSKEQLEEMFPDRMEFSKFQIERVRERNELTQRLMNLNGMNESMYGVGSGRIAGERGREYVLVKNDGVEGGWALGVVSTDKGIGDRNKPIDVDALDQQELKQSEDEEEEEDFEDVPVEGLNRLPKLPESRRQDPISRAYERPKLSAGSHTYGNGEGSRAKESPAEDLDTLFVDQEDNSGPSTRNEFAFDEEEDDINRAIELSLQQDSSPPKVPAKPADQDGSDEEEHLNLAIALSLQKNYPEQPESEEEDIFEDVPMPEYKQRAVEAPKPITTSNGKMVAHIVNNRANASVPKKKPSSVSSDSDSDLDLKAALAKARKQKAPERRRQPAPVVTNLKNPFDGPLPFESLRFKPSIFSKKTVEAEKVTEHTPRSDEDDDMAGGFDESIEDETSRPLPPWLTGGDDIRSQVQEQQKRDVELNAEDRERAHEEEMAFRRENAPIEIDSSDNESDVEILDAPPHTEQVIETTAELAEDTRANPPISEIPQDPKASETTALDAKNDSDEEVEWSESDHGDAILNSTGKVNAKHPAGGVIDRAPTDSNSPEPEFEDVEIPDGTNRPVLETTSPAQARGDSPLFPEEALPNQFESNDRELTHEPDEFDLSDPEDEELFAQLAIEAEEHARFASTLNNKTEKENQDSYERELKALRSQQKKDRRDADEVSHIMVTECQALLRLFGIPYITAPMEAEAQCAELVNLGLVDGVVTDDCDIFLFGGTRVYKNMFNSNKFVECYLSTDIEKELSLSRDQLIGIAHLLGSDYTEGLPGVGPVTALEILSEFPTPRTGLEEFSEWWKGAQLSSTKPSSESSTFRKKFRRSQNAKLFLPPGFPSPAVTEAYLKPDVDSTPEPFQWGVPDLDRLRDFLMATIGWSQERTDEVLVPVIRDMNKREQEGTQSNITRFFDGTVGVGANTNSGKDKPVGSKRMREAVTKLKAKKMGNAGMGLGSTFADEAAEWAKKNDLSWTEKEKEKASKGKKRGNKRPVVVDEEEDAGNQGMDSDLDNESEAEYRETTSKSKGRKRTKV